MGNPVGKSPVPANGRTSETLTEDAESGGIAVIEHDLPCRTCGYNLRGLSPKGECPECQTPVEHALHGDLLRYSDPRWVRTVARGMRILNSALALGLIAVIGLALYGRRIGLPWLTMATVLVIGVIAIFGVWMATVREPAMAERERLLSARRLLRGFVVATVALQAGNDFLAMQWVSGRTSMRLLAAAVLIAGILCAFRYAISLARRIPDPALVLQTRGVMWGVLVSYALSLLITALMLGGRNLPPALTIVFSLSCTVLVACVVFTLWCLTLIGRYAKALGHAAFEAETTWQGSGIAESQI